jgi:hypothetical protein
MILSKKNVLILFVGITLAGLALVVTMGGKDSEKNQLSRRLNAFVASLPQDIQKEFKAGNYDQVKVMLQSRLNEYYVFAGRLPREKVVNFMKAEYEELAPSERDLIPPDQRKFYRAYYAVLDFECIQGFSVPEVVDFFRQYFVERLKKLKGR